MIPVCGATVLACGVDCCIVGFGFGFAVMCFSLVDLLVGNLAWLFGCWFWVCVFVIVLGVVNSVGHRCRHIHCLLFDVIANCVLFDGLYLLCW